MIGNGNEKGIFHIPQYYNSKLLKMGQVQGRTKNGLTPVKCNIPTDMDALLSGKNESELESKTIVFDGIEEKTDVDWRLKQFKTLSDSVKENRELFKDTDQIHCASDRENTSDAAFGHGLLGTIFSAYSQHIPLILRPDDIWISIATAFGKYVVNHSEEMRQCFVEHEGRKELEVAVFSPFMEYTTENHWAAFVGEMEKEIRKNVTSDVVEWLDPGFTTTTIRDKAVSNVVLMGALKEYFAYKFMLCCGLPKLTLEGSLEDWQRLVTKAEHLRDFNQETLTNWADVLVPVLQEFVNAYQGNVNLDFWERICTHNRVGSGGQKKFRGWFVALSPFDADGKYLLRSKNEIEEDHIYCVIDDDDIVDCFISMPVTIEDHTAECGDFDRPGGKRYQTTFFAGMLMTQYDEGNNTLRPTTDWGIIINEEITLETLQKYVTKEIEKSYYGDVKQQAPRINELITFAFHAANEMNFPQDSLLEMADAVFSYTTWGEAVEKDFTGTELYKGFLEHLVNPKREGRAFIKYVVVSQIDDVVQSYGSTDCSH
jgi:uncharacterized protein DUF4419